MPGLKLPRNTFALSLLIHLLILLLFFNIKVLPPVHKEKTTAGLYIPSYTYTGSLSPAPAAKTAISQLNKPTPPTLETPRKEEATSKSGLRKASILDLSRASIQQNFASNAINRMKSQEPILLIGDETQLVDPLIKLMARSLSANFRYPEFEGRLGTKGRVIVALILHPSGYFSDPQILRSSNNQDFDNAALYAINTAPTVVGANRFISQPKQYVIGFIFN